MMINIAVYLKRLLKNQIAIMEYLSMQETDAYKKSQLLNNAKLIDDQWRSIEDN